jgi:hypothetical protein
MLTLPTLPKTEEQLRAYIRELQDLWKAVVTGQIDGADIDLEGLRLMMREREAVLALRKVLRRRNPRWTGAQMCEAWRLGSIVCNQGKLVTVAAVISGGIGLVKDIEHAHPPNSAEDRRAVLRVHSGASTPVARCRDREG